MNRHARLRSPKLLTVFVPSVLPRLIKGNELIATLYEQAARRDDVEVLVISDDYTRTLGAKTNDAHDMAHGEFVVTIADDDMVAPNYCEIVCEAIKECPEADVIGYGMTVEVAKPDPGGPPWMRDHRVEVSLDYGCEKRWVDPAAEVPVLRHGPWVVHPWRTSLARELRYPDMTRGIDTAWAWAANRKASAEVVIDEDLYIYRMNLAESEAKKWRETA